MIFPDNELSDRLARLRGHEPVQTPPSVPDVDPEQFLEKFPKITNKKGEEANTAIDIEKLLEEVNNINKYRQTYFHTNTVGT